MSSLGFKAGDHIDIPSLLKFALQADGWIVRSYIVWHKPAPMPSSVQGWSWRRHRIKTKSSNRAKPGTRHSDGSMSSQGARDGVNFASRSEWADCPGCQKCEANDGLVLRRGSWRPTSSWEPVIMLAKSVKYFADGEPVKTALAAATEERNLYSRILDDEDEQFAVKHDHESVTKSANLRDVWRPDFDNMSREELLDYIKSDPNLPDLWTIGAEPLKEKHYAAFPTKLVENCLRAGTSARGYCPTCGAPWARVLQGTTGWRQTCSCPPAEPRPGLVLDPFSGAGRTGEACLKLSLDYVGCELNDFYVAMSKKRLMDASPLFAGVQ